MRFEINLQTIIEHWKEERSLGRWKFVLFQTMEYLKMGVNSLDLCAARLTS
jgi:hypothetical protein